MFKKILLVTLIGVFALAACAPILPETGATSVPTAGPPATEPLPPTEPVDVPPTDSWDPAPGDELLQRVEVEIESAEIITLESFPPQYQLHVVGWKGNPCNMLRVTVAEPDAQNRIAVDVYTLLDPAATCLQVLEGLDINVPLGSLESGEYSVWLNGEQVGTIAAP
jgi:hypothetical protein